MNLELCHIGCGARVIIEHQWWADWEIWIDMPVCTIHGGPLVDDEIDLEVC